MSSCYVSYNGQRLTESLPYLEALHIATMHNFDIIRDRKLNGDDYCDAIAEVILENEKVLKL